MVKLLVLFKLMMMIDQIIIITNIGTLVRIKVLEINIIGRNTQGVKLIRTIKNENVVGLQCINEFLFKH